MVALGWVDEGVTFCATAAAAINKSSTQASFESFLLNGGIYNLQFGSSTGSNSCRLGGPIVQPPPVSGTPIA